MATSLAAAICSGIYFYRFFGSIDGPYFDDGEIYKNDGWVEILVQTDIKYWKIFYFDIRSHHIYIRTMIDNGDSNWVQVI